MPEEKDEAKPLMFADFLRDVESGRLHADATQQLKELVHEMRQLALATGGKPKGKVMIVLDVKLDGGVFEVLGDVRVTSPKQPRERSIFYATRGDQLSVVNPAQQELAIETGPPKDVTAREQAPLRVMQN